MERIVAPAKPMLRDRLLAGTVVLTVFTLCVLAVLPVPAAVRGRCDTVSGAFESARLASGADVELRLSGDPHVYYIDHGAERGLDAARLGERLGGRTVELQVIARSWSPLDPRHVMTPVAQLSESGEVLFSAYP
jgi:hypothetical protein